MLADGCTCRFELKLYAFHAFTGNAGHNFCKSCLDKKFAGIADEVDAAAATGRALRVRKVVKPCPTCKVCSPFDSKATN